MSSKGLPSYPFLLFMWNVRVFHRLSWKIDIEYLLVWLFGWMERQDKSCFNKKLVNSIPNGFLIILFISKKRTIMKDYPSGYSFLLRYKWFHSTILYLFFSFALLKHTNEKLDKGRHKQGMSYNPISSRITFRHYTFSRLTFFVFSIV